MSAPRLDLKLRLALQIAALAALCFVAAATYVLIETNRAARARTDWIAEVVARDLALQHGQALWIKGGLNAFPDLQRIAPALMAPGLCIAYRDPDGRVQQRLCSGAAPDDAAAPRLFAMLHGRLFADRESARLVAIDGQTKGEAIASMDSRSLIGQSWRETSRLLLVLAAALSGLCVLVYAALAKALRPTRTISAGLDRLAAGDLSARLPPFDLAELSRVGAVFNRLAASLETALAERNALTQRLIAVQDEERLNLARELHDEFGQCLAAIAAVAASAGQTARRDCPALLSDCESIARTCAHMMEALRGALLRLRPPEVEELGLAASLESLVAAWNRRAETRFGLALPGGLDSLPRAFAAELYRIAQEAITNAAKHARATRVDLSLRFLAPGSEPAQIELAVIDDGAALATPDLKSGMGLLGMRERVAALGGRLSIAPHQPHGLALRAVLPVPIALSAAETRDAA